MKGIKYFLTFVGLLAITLFCKMTNVYAMTNEISYQNITKQALGQVGDSWEFNFTDKNNEAYNIKIEYTNTFETTITIEKNLFTNTYTISTRAVSYMWWALIYSPSTNTLNFAYDGRFPYEIELYPQIIGSNVYIENSCNVPSGCYLDFNQDGSIGVGNSQFIDLNAYNGILAYEINLLNMSGQNGGLYQGDGTIDGTDLLIFSNVSLAYFETFPQTYIEYARFFEFIPNEPNEPLNWETKYQDSGIATIQTFDIYYKDNGNYENKITIYSTEEINLNSINKVLYGKLKHGETYKWEQINNNTYITISNENISTETGTIGGIEMYKLTYTFNTNVNITTYDTIRLGLETRANKWSLLYEQKGLSENNYYDINIMDKKYNLDIIEIQANQYNALLIDSLNNANITYNWWQKNYTGMDYYGQMNYDPFALPTLYNKEDKVVEDTIPVELQLTTEDWVYWRRYIKLGSNAKYSLYYYLYNEDEHVGEIVLGGTSLNYIYFTTQVTYTKGEGLNFSIYDWTNDTTSEEQYNVSNPWVHNNMSQYNKVNMNWLRNFIIDLESKKEEWNVFFESIWRNLDEWIKNLLMFLYFMMHCIGIFIIFKD